MGQVAMPSGRRFDTDELHVVKLMHEAGTVKWSEKPFALKSGGSSHVYFSGRDDFTSNPELLELIARDGLVHLYETWPLMMQTRQFCFIGVPSADSAIASWMVAAQWFRYHGDATQSMFLPMRSVKKSHGANQSWVDGTAPAESQVVLVENVRTTGASELEALQKLESDGIRTQEVIRLSVVDRKLRSETDRMKSVYYLADIVFAFGFLGFWSKDQVAAALPELLETA